MVLVTGAAQGIGAAIADRLPSDGLPARLAGSRVMGLVKVLAPEGAEVGISASALCPAAPTTCSR